MHQLREWCAPSLSEAGTPVSDNTATLVLRSSDAAPCREELVSHFTLLYTYPRTPPVWSVEEGGAGGLAISSPEAIDVYAIGAQTLQLPDACSLPLDELMAADAARKAKKQPQTPEEAAERKEFKRQPISISVEALKKYNFPEHMIRWFTDGVLIGVQHEYARQYRKAYPLSPEAQQAIIGECERFVAMDVIEKVKDPSDVQEAMVVCPWVVVIKPDKTRCCVDCLANEYIAAPSFALPNFMDITQYVKPGSYMSVYDARDFFFAFPLHPSSRKYLAFEIPGSDDL